MTANPQIVTKRDVPTYADSIVFRSKTFLLQLRRALVDARDRNVRSHCVSPALNELPVIATSRTKLWTETDARERALVAGKIHNLRIALKKLDGVVVPA